MLPTNDVGIFITQLNWNIQATEESTSNPQPRIHKLCTTEILKHTETDTDTHTHKFKELRRLNFNKTQKQNM